MAIITDTLIEVELPGGTRGIQGIQGEPGKDGYTPIKDVDYFDGRDGIDGDGLYATWENEILHLHTIENAEEREY